VSTILRSNEDIRRATSLLTYVEGDPSPEPTPGRPSVLRVSGRPAAAARLTGRLIGRIDPFEKLPLPAGNLWIRRWTI